MKERNMAKMRKSKVAGGGVRQAEKPKLAAIERRRRVAWICATVIALAGFAALVFVDYGVLADRIKAIGYEPSAEMQMIMNDVSMTSRGELVLMASRPTLLEQEEFNRTCESYNPDLSILGCFAAEYIYIYDVKNEDLSGIRQSTLAHELLHAAWYRMPRNERAKYEPLLREVYDARVDTLKPRLDKYPEESFYDELHAIVGTEVAVVEQPEALAKHYAEYFTDTAKIVSYYNAYNGKFQELKAAADRLYAEITANQEKITAETTNYNDGMTELNAAIVDFNRRAANGSFTSMTAFYAERAALVTRQGTLESLHSDISAWITDTNTLIKEYNGNVVRTQELVNSINSNTVAPGSAIED